MSRKLDKAPGHEPRAFSEAVSESQNILLQRLAALRGDVAAVEAQLDDSQTKPYAVVAVYSKHLQTFTQTYQAASPQVATTRAERSHGNLVVVAVLRRL